MKEEEFKKYVEKTDNNIKKILKNKFKIKTEKEVPQKWGKRSTVYHETGQLQKSGTKLMKKIKI